MNETGVKRVLYHASVWAGLREVQPGQEITLRPGTQNAQGLGVYFSEGRPDARAADSVRLAGLSCILCLEGVNSHKGWYRSKPSNDKKKGRPRTWHSMGNAVKAEVLANDGSIVVAKFIGFGE